MVKRLATASLVVVLAIGAAVCAPAGTREADAPIGTTPISRPSSMDTAPAVPPVSVTRPESIREIPIGDIPDEMRMEPGRLGLTDDESNCVDTAVFDYISGPGATADETAKVTALGAAVTACVDQGRIAQLITRQVRVSMVMVTDEQAECIDAEIRNADPGALAVFLGAYTYDGAGVPELQAPFVASFTSVCKIALG